MRCEFCGKSTVFGNNVSHAGNRTSRKFKANIQRKRVFINGEMRRVKICTSCLSRYKVR